MPYYDHLIAPLLTATLDRLKRGIHTIVSDLEAEFWVTPEPVAFKSRTEGQHLVGQVGGSWGKLWDCAWIRFRGRVPREAAGRPVVLLIDISGELCVVDTQGNPVQGLTTASSEFDLSLGRPGKTSFPWSGGVEVELWADGACNDLFGKYPDSGTLKQAAIAVLNEPVRQLYYDFEVLNELMAQVPEGKARRHSLKNALHSAALVLDELSDANVAEARRLLAPELARKTGDPGLSLSAVGHAHIDLAWLWPIRETIRKGARTFSTVLAMMDRYPDYVFGASQAQLYQWIKTSYPDLYQRIKQKIAEGRWEVQGGMWVEADTNLTSGESLVRQFLYGKRFFRAEFGLDMKMLWLPDVFGYSAALPQIMKEAGVSYFMTTKLSWNKFNVHPHHTFVWEGLGGASVLVHMPPEGTYNSSAAPRAVAAAETAFREKGVSDRALLLYGIGDGGGGPGEEHLERLAREKDLHGLVPVKQESALDFFHHIDSPDTPWQRWTGELYFEMHQGTYTSQGRTKRWNRLLENQLRDLETANAMALVQGRPTTQRSEVEELWREVLLYQFHDILPGSSIGRVYAEAEARYAMLSERVQRLRDKVLGDEVPTGKPATAVFNPLPFSRSEWVGEGDEARLVQVSALSVTPLADLPQGQAMFGLVTDSVLENEALKAEFAGDGTLLSLYDKARGRECLVGPGNALTVYYDTGDAWDFSVDYRQRVAGRFVSTETTVFTDGPRLVRRTKYSFGNSTLEQDVVLVAGGRRLDFVTRVDWRERNRMLRTSFGTSLRRPEVACDLPYGHIMRPTTRNTSWEEAKFEICAHQWVSVDEEGFGLALLNNGKYGHHAEPGLLDLNLLRSPGFPDPDADAGHHEFTYSLFPHDDLAEVDKEALCLNNPLLVLSSALSCATLFETDHPRLVIDAVKVAEEGRAVIVRVYEGGGAQVRGRIAAGFPFQSVSRVNLLEEDARPLVAEADGVSLKLAPFELASLRFEL